MSPSLALQSDVFLFYMILVIGLLTIAGIVIGILKWGLRKDVGHAWRAYCGWLFIVPLLLLVFYLGREACIIFLTVISILGAGEFARATGLQSSGLAPRAVACARVFSAAVTLGIIANGAAALMQHPKTGAPGWFALFMALPVFVIAAIVLIPVVRDRTQGQLDALARAVFAYVYCGWMFGHLAFLANSLYAYSYLGYLVLGVELNDVAAFTFGKLFGRHPLRRNISPKKTWEGAGGALAVSLLLPWAQHFTFPHFDRWDCIIVGLLVGIGGQMGDLVLSVIKRDLGIKDMGGLIPGHGGILDRIDSLIFVAPLFLHYICYRHGLQTLP